MNTSLPPLEASEDSSALRKVGAEQQHRARGDIPAIHRRAKSTSCPAKHTNTRPSHSCPQCKARHCKHECAQKQTDATSPPTFSPAPSRRWSRRQILMSYQDRVPVAHISLRCCVVRLLAALISGGCRLFLGRATFQVARKGLAAACLVSDLEPIWVEVTRNGMGWLMEEMITTNLVGCFKRGDFQAYRTT